MIDRYQSAQMKEWWSDAHKFSVWFNVERAYLEAYCEHEKLDEARALSALKELQTTIDWSQFSLLVERYDQAVKHDVIAFLHALEDHAGEHARLVHVGLTSSDIVDTAFGYLLKGAGEIISAKLDHAIKTLWHKAQEYKGVAMLGRTHGQAAEATTFGIKLLGFVAELWRDKLRLREALQSIQVGKFSGAVGIYAHTHPSIEKRALKILGLEPETVATQVVARDRHAAFFTSLAILAGSIERLATEIRLLMHGQVQEAFEPFGQKQKGSSAMPHKKNPVLSENLTGLMRMMRSYALAALENQALWHERDISHSSVERIIAPDATSIMEFALTRLEAVIKDLVVDKERLAQNLHAAGDKLYSQGVMLALVKAGMMRQAAYEMVQKAALQSRHSMKEALLEFGIEQHLPKPKLDEIFSSQTVTRYEEDLYERVGSLIKVSSQAFV